MSADLIDFAAFMRLSAPPVPAPPTSPQPTAPIYSTALVARCATLLTLASGPSPYTGMGLRPIIRIPILRCITWAVGFADGINQGAAGSGSIPHSSSVGSGPTAVLPPRRAHGRPIASHPGSQQLSRSPVRFGGGCRGPQFQIPQCRTQVQDHVEFPPVALKVMSSSALRAAARSRQPFFCVEHSPGRESGCQIFALTTM